MVYQSLALAACLFTALLTASFACEGEGDPATDVVPATDVPAGPHLVLLAGPPSYVPDGRITLTVEVARATRFALTGSCASYVEKFAAFTGVGDLVLPFTDRPPFRDGVYADCALTASMGSQEVSVPLPPFEVDTAIPTLVRVDTWPALVRSATPTITVSTNKAGELVWTGRCLGPQEVAGGESALEIRDRDGSPFEDGWVEGCSVVLVDRHARTTARLELGRFHVAAQAPVLTLVTGPPLYTRDSRPRIELDVTEASDLDPGGPCTVAPRSLPAGTSTVELVVATSGAPPVDKVIEGCNLVAIDVSGTRSNKLIFETFHLDQTPPTVRLLTPPLEVSSHPTATLEVSEPVRVALGGDCAGGLDEVDGRFEVELRPEGAPTDGLFRCTVTVYDRAGHEVDLVIPDFELDVTPPSLLVHSQPVGRGHRGVGLAIEVEVDEPSILTLADCGLRLSPEVPIDGRRRLALVGPDGGPVPQGKYDCRVWASDLVDLESEVLTLEGFEVDALTVTLLESPTLTRDASVTILSSHAATVTASVGYRVAPQAVAAGRSELSLTAQAGGPLADGSHSPRLLFALPGHDATLEVWVPSFTVDTLAPEVSVTSYRVVPGLVEVTLESSEAGGLHVTGACRAALATVPAGTTALAVLGLDGAPLTNGSHRCAFTVTDAVGNTSPPAELVLEVERPIPSLTLITPPEASGTSLTRTFQLSSTLAGELFTSGCPEGLPGRLTQGTQTLTLIGTAGDGYASCALLVLADSGFWSQWLFLPRFTFTGPTVLREFSDSGRNLAFSDITPLTGGGYIVVGETSQHGYVGRLDPMMGVVWMKQLIGLRPLTAVVDDDDVFIAGATAINVGRGAGDGFVMRLDSDGEIVWHRVLGTGAVDSFDDVIFFGQGSVRLAGVTAGSGVGLEGWRVNFSTEGELTSNYTYGTAEGDLFTGLATDGSRMLMVGSTGPDFLGSDVLVVVTDIIGNQPRGYRYAGGSHDQAMAVRQSGTDMYIAGATWSFGGPASDPVSYRGFVMRVGTYDGNIAWQRALGGRPTDLALAGSNVLVVGSTPDYGDAWSVGDGRFEDYTEGSFFDGVLWAHSISTGAASFLKILEQGQTTRLASVIRGLDDKLVLGGSSDPTGRPESGLVGRLEVDGSFAGTSSCSKVRSLPPSRASIPGNLRRSEVTITRGESSATFTSVTLHQIAPWLIEAVPDDICL